MECFNCFQRGFCPCSVKSPSGKILNFCSPACGQVQVIDNHLWYVEGEIKRATNIFKHMKTVKQDLFTIPSQKIVFTQSLFYKSLLARKSKTELNRILNLLKDQMVEMLTLIGDTSSENTMLIFAAKMKDVNFIGPDLIEVLGS